MNYKVKENKGKYQKPKTKKNRETNEMSEFAFKAKEL